MTSRLRSCLWGLRIYGPCSNVELARKLGRDREAVYRAVYELREMGLAERTGEASYDVTEAGRASLAAPAEGDASIVGVEVQGMLFGGMP